MSTRQFLYKFRFFADFLAIGTLCFMAILTIVVIYLTHNILDEIDEVSSVFFEKKRVFELYATDAENLMQQERHLNGFSDIFGTLIRTPRHSSNSCN